MRPPPSVSAAVEASATDRSSAVLEKRFAGLGRKNGKRARNKHTKKRNMLQNSRYSCTFRIVSGLSKWNKWNGMEWNVPFGMCVCQPKTGYRKIQPGASGGVFSLRQDFSIGSFQLIHTHSKWNIPFHLFHSIPFHA